MNAPNIYRSPATLRLVQAVAAAGAFWLAGLAWFLMSLPQSDRPGDGFTADGIVVLTGGPGRIKAGLEALANGDGERLLVSGVNSDLAEETILNAIGVGQESQACCIDLGRQARDTRGNAIEAAEWAARHDFSSLLVVTADYHLPRALIEFKGEMKDVKLLVHAVADQASLLSMASEFNKYLFSVARNLVGRAETRD